MLRSSSFLKRTVWRARRASARARSQPRAATQAPARSWPRHARMRVAPQLSRPRAAARVGGGVQRGNRVCRRSPPRTRLHARDGLHHRRLAVRHVTDGACGAAARRSERAITAGASRGERRSGRAPILMVAWRLMTSGDSGVSLVTSSVAKSCGAARRREQRGATQRAPRQTAAHLLHQPLFGLIHGVRPSSTRPNA